MKGISDKSGKSCRSSQVSGSEVIVFIKPFAARITAISTLAKNNRTRFLLKGEIFDFLNSIVVNSSCRLAAGWTNLLRSIFFYEELYIMICIGRLKIEILHEKLNSTCTTNFYFYRFAGTSDSGIMTSWRLDLKA